MKLLLLSLVLGLCLWCTYVRAAKSSQNDQIFEYRYLTEEEYQKFLQDDPWRGLWVSMETLIFTCLNIWHFISTFNSKEVQSDPKSGKRKKSETSSQTHLSSRLLDSYWEKTALIYAFFNAFFPQRYLFRSITTGYNIFSRIPNATMSQYPILVDKWDKEVHRPMVEPVYGEISKIAWGEIALRKILGKFLKIRQEGTVLKFMQRAYYPAAFSITFLLNLFLLASAITDWPVDDNSMKYTYRFPLNPRSLDAHLEYWIIILFAPLNGFLIWLSLAMPQRFSKLQQRYFVATFAIQSLNTLPTIKDRLYYAVWLIWTHPWSVDSFLWVVSGGFYYQLLLHIPVIFVNFLIHSIIPWATIPELGFKQEL